MPEPEDKIEEKVPETEVESDTIELVKKTYEDKILSLTADFEKKLLEKDAVIVQLVKGATSEVQQSQEEILLERLNKLKRR
jgi:argininosuccinate synthase